jgi:hypothetical protein
MRSCVGRGAADVQVVGRSATLGLALLSLAMACHGSVPPSEAWAVRDAVFRQQIGYWLGEHERAMGMVACLGTQDEGGAHGVGPAHLRRFPGETALRSLEECESRPDGAVELRTGKPAVLLMVGRVEWRGRDEAVVEAFHYRTRVASGRGAYQAARRESQWVCLGPIIRNAPD